MEQKENIYPCYHVIPVDPSLDVHEAWREICIMGLRTTYTGQEKWAVVGCDGEECSSIQENYDE